MNIAKEAHFSSPLILWALEIPDLALCLFFNLQNQGIKFDYLNYEILDTLVKRETRHIHLIL